MYLLKKKSFVFGLLFAVTAFQAGAQTASQAQPASSTAVPERCWQYFKVQLDQRGSAIDPAQLRSALLSSAAVECNFDAKESSVLMKCEKGTTIAHVKDALTSIHVTVVSYQERYTNQTPVIFK